ncbi:winged helix-turn-helix transcriptional regulator [Mesonia sp. K7]|uniref:winged helix-turn-helix transcriptional regulator n=1 Tax=Mesonia sp. K7 TaxID=2218606 RepID=UPI000DAA8C45|nr:winged helix-turn-helix transcriptional regulator [Mesonia sp. K7]PZD76648.1 hypothetical protein DNG35_11280 [Mesonia sp. K7]
MFTEIIRSPFDFNTWVDKWVDNLTDNKVNIIKAIHEDSKVSKRELKDKVGLSPTAIDNNLDALKDLGLTERIGSAKGGYWQINYILVGRKVSGKYHLNKPKYQRAIRPLQQTCPFQNETTFQFDCF